MDENENTRLNKFPEEFRPEQGMQRAQSEERQVDVVKADQTDNQIVQCRRLPEWYFVICKT
jgi:hypothetical protein